MRKQMKIAALTSAAALLAIGASMTSFAKWVPVGDGTQMWVDNYGDPEAGWHRYGGEYYCTDDEGHVITNSLISADGYVDDLAATTVYYVDAYGARTKNYWVSVPNDEEVVTGTLDDGTEYVPATLYMYAGAKRAITKRTDAPLAAKVNKTSSTTDTGIFVFDQNGYMMGGEVEAKVSSDPAKTDTAIYYCVTLDDLADNLIELEEGTLAEKYVEGQALEGWAKFYTNSLADDEGYVWRYYKNGQMVTGEQTLKWQGTTANYYFDKTTGNLDKTYNLQRTATVPDATSSVTFDTKTNDDGTIVTKTGWYSKDENSDGTAEWYYIVNVIDSDHKLVKGVVFNYNKNGEKRAKVIDGKTYVFDANGKMLDGPQEIDSTYVSTPWHGIACTTLTQGKTYYFNSKANSGHRGEKEDGRVTYTVGDVEVTSYVDPVEGLMKNAIIKDYYYDSNGYLYTALDDAYEFVPLSKLSALDSYAVQSGKTLTTGTDLKKDAPAGACIIVDKKGRVLKGGINTPKKIGDVTYFLNGYIATLNKQ